MELSEEKEVKENDIPEPNHDESVIFSQHAPGRD